MSNPRFADAHKALAFMSAGKAVVTFVSGKTGTRFSFRICRPNDEDEHGHKKPDNGFRFVSVLTQSDNTDPRAYAYIGFVKPNGVFFYGNKSRIGEKAPSVQAFKWGWQKLQQGILPEALSIFHEGRCGRCARLLTVPASVVSGFGPECAGKVGAFYAEAA